MLVQAAGAGSGCSQRVALCEAMRVTERRMGSTPVSTTPAGERTVSSHHLGKAAPKEEVR